MIQLDLEVPDGQGAQNLAGYAKHFGVWNHYSYVEFECVGLHEAVMSQRWDNACTRPLYSFALGACHAASAEHVALRRGGDTTLNIELPVANRRIVRKERPTLLRRQ